MLATASPAGGREGGGGLAVVVVVVLVVLDGGTVVEEPATELDGVDAVVVRLRSVVCLLGRFPALAGVDFDAGEGEVVLLSGANGAGKTTLLRLLAGLVPLYSGTATVLGHDLAVDRRGARRELALVGHE